MPHTPFTQWTETAPTGSSTWILSKKNTLRTTSTPPMAPMSRAAFGVTRSQGAVIATRPASEPFRAIVRSGLPMTIQAVTSAAQVPAQAARFVVIATRLIEPMPAV